MGLDPALAAGLAYLFGGHFAGILPIIWLIAEKRNRFIRFHSVQALLGIAAYLVGALIAASIFVVGLLIAQASGADSQTAGAIASAAAIAFFAVLTMAALVCDIWGMIAGFTGKFVKLPLVGNIAVRLVGGPPIPAY